MKSPLSYSFNANVFSLTPLIIDSETVLFGLGSLQSVNMKTGKVNWTCQANPGVWATIVGGIIYIGVSGNTVCAIDATNGTTQWSVAVTDNVIGVWVDPGSGTVLAGDISGNFYAINPTTQKISWKFTFPNSVAQQAFPKPPAIVDGTVFSASVTAPPNKLPTGGYVSATDIVTGANQWTHNLEQAPTSPLCAGDGMVFVGCSDSTFRALDQTNGNEAWRYQMGDQVTFQPVYLNGWVYFGSKDGNLYAHPSQSQSTPPTIGKLSLGPVYTDIVVDSSGNGYFAVVNPSVASTLYTVPLASVQQGSSAAALATNEPNWPNGLSPVAHNKIAFCSISNTEPGAHGDVYLFDIEELSSATSNTPSAASQATPQPSTEDSTKSGSASLSQRTQFKSQLIVDQYDVSGTSATPTTPAFQMMLSLFDQHMAPETSAKVSVWASEEVTLTVNGQNYPISTDQNSATVLTASSAGQLTMTAPAAVSMANLYFQPDFFDSSSYLTGFPDQGNALRLMNLQSSDLDPATAVGYDGQPMLLPAYQNTDSQNSIASAISNTVGGQPPQSSMMTMASLTGDPPTRPYQPGAVPNFTVDFTSGISFTPNTSSQDLNPSAGITGDFLGIGEFIDNIVNGTEQIGSIIWTFANGVANAIVNGLENAYQFAVQTVDQAIQVATGIFKQVVADISKVYEWLSYLFSWTDIVNTHTLIKNQATQFITGFQDWIDAQLQQTTTDALAFFNNAEANAVAWFDDIIKKLGTQSVSGMQKKGGDPNAAFSSSGQDVTTQANWLPRKLTENAAGVSLPTSSGLTGDTSSVLTAIETFFKSVGDQITSDPNLQQLPADAKTALQSFAHLFTGSGFTGQTLADVLGVVRDLIAGFIHFGQVVVDSFLQLLQNIINGLVTFFTTPIQIPFLSDLYQAIANDQLSLLSLFSLIVAVPTTIVYKLVHGTAPGSGSDASITVAQEVLGMANTFTLLLLLPLWISADLGSFAPVILGCIVVASLVQLILVAVLIALTNGTGPDYVLCVFQFFAVVIAFIAAVADPAFVAATAPIVYGVYGLGMMFIYILYVIADSDKYFGKDGVVFFNNFASVLPYMGQPLSYIEYLDIGPAAVSLVDFVGYGTSAALSTILFWASPPASMETA